MTCEHEVELKRIIIRRYIFTCCPQEQQADDADAGQSGRQRQDADVRHHLSGAVQPGGVAHLADVRLPGEADHQLCRQERRQQGDHAT